MRSTRLDEAFSMRCGGTRLPDVHVQRPSHQSKAIDSKNQGSAISGGWHSGCAIGVESAGVPFGLAGGGTTRRAVLSPSADPLRLPWCSSSRALPGCPEARAHCASPRGAWSLH